MARGATAAFRAEAMAPPPGGGGPGQGQGQGQGQGSGGGGFMVEGLTGGLGESGFREAPARQQASGPEELLGRDLVRGALPGGRAAAAAGLLIVS